MINNHLPPVPSSLEQVQPAVEAARAEHKKLLKETEEARALKLTHEVQKKQLADQADFLAKEQKRIQEWDKAVLEREKQHHTLHADTGVIYGSLQ